MYDDNNSQANQPDDASQDSSQVATPAYPASAIGLPDTSSADASSPTDLPAPTMPAMPVESPPTPTPSSSSDDNAALDDLASESTTSAPMTDPISAPAVDLPDPEPAVVPSPAPTSTDPDSTNDRADDAMGDDLVGLKQKALQQLSPLVDHLDQTAEEKFKTTMMMIQASDDKNLLKVAYQAAQDIQDEKVRAQALLDVVNEVNYFTQHSN